AAPAARREGRGAAGGAGAGRRGRSRGGGRHRGGGGRYGVGGRGRRSGGGDEIDGDPPGFEVDPADLRPRRGGRRVQRQDNAVGGERGERIGPEPAEGGEIEGPDSVGGPDAFGGPRPAVGRRP